MSYDIYDSYESSLPVPVPQAGYRLVSDKGFTKVYVNPCGERDERGRCYETSERWSKSPDDPWIWVVDRAYGRPPCCGGG